MIQTRTTNGCYTELYLAKDGEVYCLIKLMESPKNTEELLTHIKFYKYSLSTHKEFYQDIEDIKDLYRDRYKRFVGVNSANDDKWQKFLAVFGFTRYNLNEQYDVAVLSMEE